MGTSQRSEERRQAILEILGEIAPRIQTILNIAPRAIDLEQLASEMKVLHERLDRLAPLFIEYPDVRQAVSHLGNLGGSAVSPHFPLTVKVFELFSEDVNILEDALKQENKVSAERDGELLRRDEDTALISDTNREELNTAQKRDYGVHDYRCRDKIHIPGSTPKYRSNIVVVNEHEANVGDKPFNLLVRLIVELKKENGGWVSVHDLVEEGIAADREHHQIYSRLRKSIEGSLLNRDAKQLIENDGSKRYRISTHPDFVTYEKEQLSSHNDELIRSSAVKLP